MVAASSTTPQSCRLAQDASQSSADPSAHLAQRFHANVFEVSKRALQLGLQSLDEGREALSVGPPRQRLEALFELLLTLGSDDPANASAGFASPKPIPQEVEVALALPNVHDSGFLGMQFQSGLACSIAQVVQHVHRACGMIERRDERAFELRGIMTGSRHDASLRFEFLIDGRAGKPGRVEQPGFRVRVYRLRRSARHAVFSRSTAMLAFQRGVCAVSAMAVSPKYSRTSSAIFSLSP